MPHVRRVVVFAPDLGRLWPEPLQEPGDQSLVQPLEDAGRPKPRFWGLGKHKQKTYSNFSKIPAAPMPPPTHIVTMPKRTLRLRISATSVAVSFAPVQPSG